MADSVYQGVIPLRGYVVIHKIFDDKDWETYLVEFSFNYHGGCGCPSYADYITFNKYDRHQLTENETLAKYDETKIRNKLDKEFANAKIKMVMSRLVDQMNIQIDCLGHPELHILKTAF